MGTPVLLVQDVEGNSRPAVSTDTVTDPSARTSTGVETHNGAATFTDLRVASQIGLTALVGGAQAGTALKPGFNQFSAVASGGDSAQLPVALPGMIVIVSTIAATNALAVFAQTGDTINAIAANAAFSLATVKVAIFICATAGKWYTILTA